MKYIYLVLFLMLLTLIGIDVKYRIEPKTIVIEKEVCSIPNKYLGEFEASHYTHTGFRCSTGVYPKVGRTVAIDPKVIPYGTYLYIEGYGVRVCEDCGGAIKGKKLDIFVNTHNEAVKLGRKKVKVWVLTNKK